MSSLLQQLREVHHVNLATLRSNPLAEISGSFGDLGTLLPLLIALSIQNSISLSSSLVFSGLANISTGIYYGIPLPVQPMKAIASIAIANSFSRAETASAGLFVAVCILVFSVTGLLARFTRLIPLPVVRGIQVGAGLSLVISAGTSLLRPLGWTHPLLDNHLFSLLAFLAVLVSAAYCRLPTALLLTLLGLGLSVLSMRIEGRPSSWKWIMWRPDVQVPSHPAIRTGVFTAGLPQLPLTTLNSLLAVSALAHSLSPPLHPAPSPVSLGYSVAVINLIGPWFGAMPVCHGSGGLAAQYAFGARSGASVVMLGAVKLVLGLVVGDGVLGILRSFPKSLLGVMVVAAGVELAKVGRDLGHGESEVEQWQIMLVTVAGCLAFKNDGVGFAMGMVWYWGMKVHRGIAQRGFRNLLKREGERQPLLQD